MSHGGSGTGVSDGTSSESRGDGCFLHCTDLGALMDRQSEWSVEESRLAGSDMRGNGPVKTFSPNGPAISPPAFREPSLLGAPLGAAHMSWATPILQLSRQAPR